MIYHKQSKIYEYVFDLAQGVINHNHSQMYSVAEQCHQLLVLVKCESECEHGLS